MATAECVLGSGSLLERADPMTLTARIAFIVLPLAMTGWLQAQVRMRAGLWENTVTAMGKSVTQNACITSEQEKQSSGTAEAMRATLEKNMAKAGGCKLQEFTMTGDTQTMVMICGKTTMKHVTKFHLDSFETNSTATTPQGDKSSVIKGRRIGDCPAGGVK
jgi:hypothetical protein